MFLAGLASFRVGRLRLHDAEAGEWPRSVKLSVGLPDVEPGVVIGDWNKECRALPSRRIIHRLTSRTYRAT